MSYEADNMFTFCIISIIFSASHTASGASIGNITVNEGDDVEFRWIYSASVDRIEWYKGTITDKLLMKWELGKVIKYISNIEYIDETNSVGMILRGVTQEESGLYTVTVLATDGIRVQLDAYLEVNPKPAPLGLSTTMIIIIVVVVVVVCAILVVIIVCVLKKKKKICFKPKIDEDKAERQNDKPKENAGGKPLESLTAENETTNSMNENQDQPGTPATLSEVAIKDNRDNSAVPRQQMSTRFTPQHSDTFILDEVLTSGIPTQVPDSPRKLPPRTLPPVNRINPEENPDYSEQEMKKKKKHKKHKKKHRNERPLEDEEHSEENEGYENAGNSN